MGFIDFYTTIVGGGSRIFREQLSGDRVQGEEMQDARCKIHDAGYWMLDTGCKMQDTGCRMQDAGYLA